MQMIPTRGGAFQENHFDEQPRRPIIPTSTCDHGIDVSDPPFMLPVFTMLNRSAPKALPRFQQLKVAPYIEEFR